MTRRHWAGGFLGGVVGLLAGYAVAFPILMLIGPETVFNEAIQSPKLLAVWGELEPEPLVFANPVIYGLGLAVIGGVQGLVFAGIATALPQGRFQRGLTFGVIVSAIAYLFAEFAWPAGLGSSAGFACRSRFWLSRFPWSEWSWQCN